MSGSNDPEEKRSYLLGVFSERGRAYTTALLKRDIITLGMTKEKAEEENRNKKASTSSDQEATSEAAEEKTRFYADEHPRVLVIIGWRELIEEKY